MLSGSITLHRRSKDGVGISNVDVVFALGDSDYIAPSDGAGWKTLFSELTLTAGKYVWSCTKVTKTDRSVEYTGKYCMGYATDFTDVVEQYALSSSGTTAPTSGWGTTYQPKKGMYLWTRNAYNWKNSSITYSTPRCVNYFPNDGVNGSAGEDGHNLTLVVSPSKFILDVDKGMQISNGGKKYFSYTGYFGDETITDDTKGASFSISCPSGCNFNENYIGFDNNHYFNTDGIERKTCTVADKTKTAPCSSAYFEVTLTYKGFSVTQRVDIVCNMTICEMDQIMTNEEFQSTYEAKVTEQGKQIADNTSKITQTASEVSSKVSKTEYDANNKAINTQFSTIKQNADSLSLEVSNFKSDLSKTGIDVTNRKIKATADNFVVQNNKGVNTMTIDANGNLVTGNLIANGGQIGSFNITNFTDATGFTFYGLSAHTDGTTVIPSATTRIDYTGAYFGNGSTYLGCSATIGTSSKVNNEFSWENGMVYVDGNFSASSTTGKQAGFYSYMYGNGKNKVIGYKANVHNGAQNYAFYAENGDVYAENGSVKSKKFCGSFGLSQLTLSSSKQYYNNSELDVSQNSTWLIYASQTRYNIVALPKLSAVRKFLDNASSFCLRLTIIAKRGSQMFYIRGRSDSDANLSGSEYPYFINNDGNNSSEPGLTSGDIVELALFYDGINYYCYCLNSRN